MSYPFPNKNIIILYAPGPCINGQAPQGEIFVSYCLQNTQDYIHADKKQYTSVGTVKLKYE
jgi:hypothetical protein